MRFKLNQGQFAPFIAIIYLFIYFQSNRQSERDCVSKLCKFINFETWEFKMNIWILSHLHSEFTISYLA